MRGVPETNEIYAEINEQASRHFILVKELVDINIQLLASHKGSKLTAEVDPAILAETTRLLDKFNLLLICLANARQMENVPLVQTAGTK